MQCIELAVSYAVETVNAAAVVYSVIRYIDAPCLTIIFADLAVLALVHVNYRTEDRKSREETKRSANRADNIAVFPAGEPGQKDGQHQGGSSDCENDAGLEMHNALKYAAVGTVWRKDSYERLESENDCQYEKYPYAVAKPFQFFAIVEWLAVLTNALGDYACV